MKKWMPYVALISIFGLCWFMYSCNKPPAMVEDTPVQVMAQPETEEPAKAEAPVEVVPDVVPEVIEPESAPADEGTGDEPISPVISE
jgi:hypothetical protein